MKVRILAAAVLATMFACSLEVSAGRGGGAAAPTLVGIESDQIPGFYRGFTAYNTGAISATDAVISTFGGFNIPVTGPASEGGDMVVIGSKIYFAQMFSTDGGAKHKIASMNLDGSGYAVLTDMSDIGGYARLGSLAQGPDGGLYMACEWGGVFKVDTTTGVKTQLTTGVNFYTIQASALAFDGAGNLYVGTKTGVVNKYDAATGALITANWATGLTGSDQNNGIRDMLVTGGQLVASVDGTGMGYFAMDLATGVQTKIHDPVTWGKIVGYMDVNPVDGTIWTQATYTSNFVSFSVDGITSNTFGPFADATSGKDLITPYGGLAFLPVPEPTSMLLLGLGSVALLRRRK